MSSAADSLIAGLQADCTAAETADVACAFVWRLPTDEIMR